MAILLLRVLQVLAGEIPIGGTRGSLQKSAAPRVTPGKVLLDSNTAGAYAVWDKDVDISNRLRSNMHTCKGMCMYLQIFQDPTEKPEPEGTSPHGAPVPWHRHN